MNPIRPTWQPPTHGTPGRPCEQPPRVDAVAGQSDERSQTSVTRILITGGAGFIGSNLARLALASPEVTGVVVLDDLSTGDRGNLEGLDVEFHHGSITDPAALEKAVAGVDAVVHLAAMASG